MRAGCVQRAADDRRQLQAQQQEHCTVDGRLHHRPHAFRLHAFGDEVAAPQVGEIGSDSRGDRGKNAWDADLLGQEVSSEGKQHEFQRQRQNRRAQIETLALGKAPAFGEPAPALNIDIRTNAS